MYLRHITDGQEKLIDEQQEVITKLLDQVQEYRDALKL